MVILRGALDGMSAVVPYGDPALAGLRGEIWSPNGLLDLGGFYGLHPSLSQPARRCTGRRAAAGARRRRPNAGAQPFRGTGLPGERRRSSHDQRLAEPRGRRDAGCQRDGRPEGDAVAIGVSVPLLLRGSGDGRQLGAARRHLAASPDLYTQIAALNQADRVTGPAIAEGLRERGFTGAVSDRRRHDAAGRQSLRLPGAGTRRRRAAARAGRSTHRRAGDRRLGHARRAGAAADPRAGGARRRAGRAEGRPGPGVEADRGAGDDRVRPHRAGERHQGHRPRHRDGRLRAGRRGGRRARARRTGRAWVPASCSRTATCSRPRICASVAKGLLAQHLGLAAAGARQVFPDSATAQPMNRSDPRLSD